MRFGVCYNVEYREDVHKTPSHYFGRILEQVELLEKAGFDTVWFSEHHCAAYSFGNPAVMAAAAAQRTKHIRLGIGVSLLPLHHPIFLSEQYGLLDVLSNGRLEFGIGRGYLMFEYDWLKIPRGESYDRYHEAMDFITQAWTSDGRPMSFHGKFHDVDDYTYFPKTVQQPYPPVYASAGSTLDSFRWAGEKGFHLGTALFLPNPQLMIDGIALYRKALTDNGYDPSKLEVMGITQMYCAQDHEQALADGRIFTENYYRFFAELTGEKANNPMFKTYSSVNALEMNQRGQLLLGDPAHLVERLKMYRDTFGMSLILMEVAQGGAPHDKVCSAIELFGAKVMPHFKK